MRRIPYLIGARLADWYHGRRDGQAVLPDRRTAVGRITTPHRETLIRLALEVFEHERLRYERDRGDAPERLVAATARLDQLRAHWVDANRYVTEVSRPLTDAEKTWRRLGDLDRTEPVVIQRRQTEHRQRIATARLTLDSITAEIGHVEADAAAAAETSRRSLEVATTRVLRVHEYVHRRMNSYLRTLIRWHPDGAWAGAHLTVAPDLPGWITVNAAPPEPVKLPSRPPEPLEEEYEQPRLIDLNADGPTDFGSDPKLAHHVITDLRAAPRHFRLTRLAEDRLRLNDFGHGHGPYRLGQPVKQADLAPGDEFDFADHRYRVLDGCRQLEVTALRPVRLVVHEVCAKALDKANKQEKNLLVDMTFMVGESTLLAVLGRSGAGKSTLLNVLIGDQRPDRGLAYFTDLDLLQHSPEVADALGFVPQRTDLHTSLTTRQLLRYAFDLRMKPSQRRHREDRIEEVCEKLELSGQLDQLISTMSGGQERRVSIAAELLSRPRLLILDEPTSGLDPGMDRQIMQHLHEYAMEKDDKGGRTVIVTTHSTSHLHLADVVLVVGEYGRPIYFGPPAQVLQSLNVTASKPVTGRKPTYADLMDKLAPWPGQQPNGWSAARAERYAGQQSVSTAKEQAEKQARDAADRSARKRPAGKQQTRLVQRPVFRRQLKTLLSRQVTLLRVRGRTGTGWSLRGAVTASLPFAIAVIGAVVAAAITPDGGLADPGTSAEIALSVLTTLSVLSGQALTYGDLVTDFPVIRREYRTGTGLPAVVLSKWLVFAGMAAIQAVIIAELFLRFQPGPAYAITFLPRQVELCLDLVALTVSAMSLGLLISALAPKLERAVAYITLVSIAQIALNGVTSAVPGYLNVPALLLPDRWGLAAIASSVNLDRITKPPPQPADALWAHTPAQWLTDIIMVTALTVLYTVLAAYVLRMRMRPRGGRPGSLLGWRR